MLLNEQNQSYSLHPGPGVNGNLYLGGDTGYSKFVYSEIAIDQMMVWHEHFSGEDSWQIYVQGGQV